MVVYAIVKEKGASLRPVSYTHLDVYKRQDIKCAFFKCSSEESLIKCSNILFNAFIASFLFCITSSFVNSFDISFPLPLYLYNRQG